jgi:hypothetical protein
MPAQWRRMGRGAGGNVVLAAMTGEWLHRLWRSESTTNDAPGNTDDNDNNNIASFARLALPLVVTIVCQLALLLYATRRRAPDPAQAQVQV